MVYTLTATQRTPESVDLSVFPNSVLVTSRKSTASGTRNPLWTTVRRVFTRCVDHQRALAACTTERYVL